MKQGYIVVTDAGLVTNVLAASIEVYMQDEHKALPDARRCGECHQAVEPVRPSVHFSGMTVMFFRDDHDRGYTVIRYDHRLHDKRWWQHKLRLVREEETK